MIRTTKLTALLAGLLSVTSTSAHGLYDRINSSSKWSLASKSTDTEDVEEIVDNQLLSASNDGQNTSTRGEESRVSNSSSNVSSISSKSSSENESDSSSSSSSSESSMEETKRRRLLHYLRSRLIRKSLVGSSKQDDDIPTGIQYANNDGHWWLWNVEDKI